MVEQHYRDLVRECPTQEALATALRTLITYGNNVRQHPDVAKYRSINLTNTAFVARVGQYSSGMEILKALGFTPECGCLVLKASLNTAALDALQQLSREGGAAAAAPPPEECKAEVRAQGTDAKQNPEEEEEEEERVVPPPVISAASPVAGQRERKPPAARRSLTPPCTPQGIWGCAWCTFHNPRCNMECEMCGKPRAGPRPGMVDRGCTPMPRKVVVRTVSDASTWVTPLPARVTRSSSCSPSRTVDCAVGEPLVTLDVGTSTAHVDPVPCALAEVGCNTSPASKEQATTAEVGCSAQIRRVKTPRAEDIENVDLEEGLQRVRHRLAQLCAAQREDWSKREASASAPAPSSSRPLRDVTNRKLGEEQRRECSTSSKADAPPGTRAGSKEGTPLRRDIAGALECGVCLSLFVHPVTTPCGHSFCRHCLVEALAKTGKRCPTCRTACDIDATSCAENTVLANAARLVDPKGYVVRCAEVLELANSQQQQGLPVLIGDDCPCPNSSCRLQLAEERDKALLRFIALKGGEFVLLPSSEGSRVRRGSVGLRCVLRRTEVLPNGHASASVTVGARIIVMQHATAPEGHTSSVVAPHLDTNEKTYSALAAAHQLKRVMHQFFQKQSANVRPQVERYAGREPPLPPLPTTISDSVAAGSTQYCFWAAAVLSHLRIVPKRLKPGLIIKRDCLARAASLCQVAGAALRGTSRHQHQPTSQRYHQQPQPTLAH